MSAKAQKMRKTAVIKEPLTAPPVNAAGRASVIEGLTESRALFLLIAATVIVYANSLGGDFLYDDLKQIVANPQLRSWGNILHAFVSDVWDFQRGTSTDVSLPYYRPLFTIYLTLGFKLFGLWTPGWHLLNLAVHAGATLAVYFLLRRLSGNGQMAALAAAIFGLHPAHVESVAWISGIPDPLAALFFVPSLLCYLRFREEERRRWLAASVFAFALSALCKETALALPLIIAVYELARKQPSLSARIKAAAGGLIPFALVAVGYLAVRVLVLGKLGWDHPMMARVPDAAIWLTVPSVVASYLQHLIAPFYLSLIYGGPFATHAADWHFLLPAALLSGLAIWLWACRRRVTPEMWVALALIFAPLLPVLNLRVFHQENIIQDRYLYLPSVGFCYLAAWLMAFVARARPKPAALLAGVVLLSFGASTALQNRVWHDATALWQRAIAYAPESWTARYNLGLAYLESKDYDAARMQLSEAARLNPHLPIIHNNLALAEARLNETDAAIESLQRALKLDPQLVEARVNLGTILFSRGDYPSAREQFLLALERDSSSLPAHFNLARAEAAMGNHAEAIKRYEALLQKAPDDGEARYQLALSYAATGRRADAVRHVEQALRLENNPDRIADMHRALERLRNSQ
jgi:tetratricopeptide (TPR) repeat protein